MWSSMPRRVRERLRQDPAIIECLRTGGPEPLSSELLRRRSMEMHNIVQFSPPAPVAADSADAAPSRAGQGVVVARA